MPIKISVNGLGRIGRNVVRQALLSEDLELVHVNDLNPSVENLAYLLNFDSTYGRMMPPAIAKADRIVVGDRTIKVTNCSSVGDINWDEHNIDILVEATGVIEVQKDIASLIAQARIARGVVTHSSTIADATIIFGVNENTYETNAHRYVSSSICDANAVAPALSVLQSNFGISGGNILTLHPWLGYQNLVDGPCRSFAYPGHFEENFALGRASTEALMPKTTSCFEAVKDVLPDLPEFMSMSYRVPTPIVSSAVLTVSLQKHVSQSNIVEVFSDVAMRQKHSVFEVSLDQAISKDFVGNCHSCIVDRRWIAVSKNTNEIRLVLWYDNEFAYSARVLDTIRMMENA